MNSTLVTVVLFIGALLVTLVGILALTGNLNGEALQRLVQGPPPPAEPPKEETDELGAFATELKARQQQLDEEQRKFEDEKRRVEISQQELDELSAKFQETLQQALPDDKTGPDPEEEARVKAAAMTIAAMDEKQAAIALESWPPEKVAEIMKFMKEKERAKILDEMSPDKVGPVIEQLRGTDTAAPSSGIGGQPAAKPATAAPSSGSGGQPAAKPATAAP